MRRQSDAIVSGTRMCGLGRAMTQEGPPLIYLLAEERNGTIEIYVGGKVIPILNGRVI